MYDGFDNTIVGLMHGASISNPLLQNQDMTTHEATFGK